MQSTCACVRARAHARAHTSVFIQADEGAEELDTKSCSPAAQPPDTPGPPGRTAGSTQQMSMEWPSKKAVRRA